MCAQRPARSHAVELQSSDGDHAGPARKCVRDGPPVSGPAAARPAALESFAQALQPTDQDALEATRNAVAIARLIAPHVRRVVIANAAAMKGIGGIKAKTDRLDAKMLAQLLAAGFLPSIWPGDEATATGDLRRREVATVSRAHGSHDEVTTRPPSTVMTSRTSSGAAAERICGPRPKPRSSAIMDRPTGRKGTTWPRRPPR